MLIDKIYLRDSTTLIDPERIEFGSIYFEMTEDIIARIGEECPDNFVFTANIMTVEGNPFDLI